MGRAPPSIEDLTELVRRQAYRIDELEAVLRMLMVAADWHTLNACRSIGEAIDDAREHLDAYQDPIADRQGH